MTDERHKCPSQVAPFLIGGALGAALTNGANQSTTAEIRHRLDRLTAVERERLAEERKRLALEQTEVQRNEADRLYHQAVLWLEHCNNDERFEWFVRGQGTALADELAARTIAGARKRREVVALFDDVFAARHALEAAEANKRGREVQRDELRRRRWTGAGVWFVCAATGFAILIPLWLRFGAGAVGVYGLFLAVSAAAGPWIARWQPMPKELASQIPGFPLVGSLREGLARVESAAAAAEAELPSAKIEHALAREAVEQTFRAQQRALLADAIGRVSAIRGRIDALQSIYPPRVRCDLAAISDKTLQAQLAPHLRAAIGRAVAAVL